MRLTRSDLGEFIGNEYVEQTSLSRALSTVGRAMYDMRVTQITNFDIQHTRMRRSMNEPWDYALDKFNTVGQAASFCGHIICQGVSYGAAGVDYMRTGNAAGIQGNLLNESFSHYINSRFRWLPKPVRDFMSGGTSYMSGEMVKDK